MRPAEGGFTLIEVLVALVVSSLLVAIIVDGAATARARQRVSRDRDDAVRLGQAVLTRAVAKPYTEDVTRGREGRLAWTVTEHIVDRDVRGYYQLDELRVDIGLPKGPVIQSFVTRKLRLVARP